MADRAVNSEELVSAFSRLRELWKGLYNELPPKAEREGPLAKVRDDLGTVLAAGRLSEEGRPFVELAYFVRMDEWRAGIGGIARARSGEEAHDKAEDKADDKADDRADGEADGEAGEEARETSGRPSGEDGFEHPGQRARDLEEAAAGVRSGFEMRLRTLRQMESGEEILSDSGREIRRSAARDLVFFDKLMALPRRKGKGGGAEPGQLARSFDPRRKLVREEVEVPNSAIEAVEFLVRLGAG